MDFIIRKCSKEDINTVLSLQKLWYQEDITYGFVPGDAAYLKGKLGAYFFLAETKEKQIIGFAYGTISQAKDMTVFQDGIQYIEIDDIYIHPEFRDTRIGGQLLDAVLGAASANGIDRSLVYSASKDMEKTIRFYKAHGYQTWFVQMFK